MKKWIKKFKSFTLTQKIIFFLVFVVAYILPVIAVIFTPIEVFHWVFLGFFMGCSMTIFILIAVCLEDEFGDKSKSPDESGDK